MLLGINDMRGGRMFGIVHYEVFILTGILLNLIPGTDTMYIVARSISQGRKAGVLSVFGILTGSLIHTLLAAFGLSVILAKSLVLFQTVKVIGVAYLVYLGVKMIVAKMSIDPANKETKELGFQKVYAQGILTSITNPKVALFFIAFLPQFVGTSDFGPMPFIILGLTFTLTGGIWCLMIAWFASYATRKLRNSSRVSAILNKLTGIVFIGMGLNLIRAKATP
jgi:RhtB (resistance to homoserine/threonine) family protein